MKKYALIALLIFLIIASSVKAQSTKTIEESDQSISWSAEWKTESSQLASGGTWKTANKIGAELTFNFEGNAVSLIYAKGPQAPVVEIEIDGIKALEINATSDTYIGRVRHIVAQNLESGKHVLKLKLISEGEKNGFAVDTFEVQSFEVGEQNQFNAFWLLGIVVLFALGIGFYKFYTQSMAKNELPKMPQKPLVRKLQQKVGVELDKRIRDIMRALDEKDKSIINYLLENKGKAKQSQIRHYLEMPRSTLSKRITILEQRNIVETKEIGKTNLVQLTPWFISGKERERS